VVGDGSRLATQLRNLLFFFLGPASEVPPWNGALSRLGVGLIFEGRPASALCRLLLPQGIATVIQPGEQLDCSALQNLRGRRSRAVVLVVGDPTAGGRS